MCRFSHRRDPMRAAWTLAILALVALGCQPRAPAGDAAATPTAAPPASVVTEAEQQRLDARRLRAPLAHHRLALNAPANARSPALSADADGTVHLTWLEPIAQGHRLRHASRAPGAEAWSSPTTVAEGPAFFANWADLPRAAALPGSDDGLVAHWLDDLGDDVYAYGARLAHRGSPDASWTPRGWLHDDTSAAEHGFVSYAVDGNALRAFWLDGRGMPANGPMQLRTATLGRDGAPSASALVDSRVCECCATSAVATADGPRIAYRGRSDEEIRDIYVARPPDPDGEPTAADASSWPRVRVHDDDWRIGGCPVNGPAIATTGAHLAVAWFTGADGRPRVQLAWSDDDGRSFAPPIVIDNDDPLGRVMVAPAGSDAVVVVWLGRGGGGPSSGEILLRRVARDGTRRPPAAAAQLAPTVIRRSAGMPQLVRAGADDGWIAAWIDSDAGVATAHIAPAAWGAPDASP
ncbi:MAG: hypothetical protein AAF772_05140 [Acidobacteriota bacterium]